MPTLNLGIVAHVDVGTTSLTEAPVAGGAWCTIEGDIRAARVRRLEQRLPGLTRGEGVLECVFGHYVPVIGHVPSRPRSDHNPLNRREYLLRATRLG